MKGLAIFVLGILSCSIARASVIGIDYGTDWFKVSLVKPGVPLELVLNAESKRKTQSLVTIRDGIRYFGSDAASLAARFPHLTFPSLKTLLGKPFTDDIPSAIPTSRNTVAFKVNETIYSVEELVGMQLSHAKRQAEIFGGEKVSGAVITVPPYFNQFERQAILDAAEIAGLKVLGLVNDETAVALNYAMTRKFKDVQHHIFYDMGAGSTVASLVRFEDIVIKETPKSRNKTVPTLQVLAVGYDSTLGGNSIDSRVQKLLADRFMEQSKGKLKGNVWDEPKALVKLMKEANRVKQILSANTQCMSGVEHLMEEIDFKTIVGRDELEAVCTDLFERVSGPINAVLEKAGLKMDQIDSLVLVGGGARVPKVQALLRDLVGEDKIAKNVNADEAAVLGAGFRAAGLSTQFRVKEFRIKDVIEAPVEVVYDLEPKEDEEKPRTLKTLLFNEKSALGSKKLMNFKRETDFSFYLQNKETNDKIISAKVTGLTSTIEKYKGQFTTPIKVKAFIELTESGLVNIEDAHAFIELDKVESGSIKDTVMSFFGAGKKEKEEDAAEGDNVHSSEDDQTPKADTNSTETESSGKKNETEKAAEKSKDTKPKGKTEKVKLTLEIQHETIPPMAEEDKQAALARMLKMDREDEEKRNREEARNVFESFIYSAKEFLYDDEVELITNEEQREKLKEQLEVSGDWLFDEGEHASTHELKLKYDAVKVLHSPMVFRRNEMRKRPEAVKKLRDSIKSIKSLLDNLKPSHSSSSASSESIEASSLSSASASASPSTTPSSPTESIFEDADVAKVIGLTETIEQWLAEKEKEQDKLPGHETPVLKTKEIEKKQKEVEDAFKQLLSKPKPKKTKKTSKTSSSSTSSSATETPTVVVEEEKASEEEKPVETDSAKPEANDDQKDHDEL